MAENSGVFLLRGEDSLVPMQPGKFDLEDHFQRLLARFPELLVGDQIDPQNPRRWILVKREQAISTGEIGSPTWAVDLVFLDQDGIPTLVEIKRKEDSRLRRGVVGQMLDYAANCRTHWTAEALQISFENSCRDEGKSHEKVLDGLLEESGTTPPEFWELVRTNLKEKNIRLLFVADSIPIELRRVVAFLNEQMKDVEVLAVELRQFVSGDLKTIVPTVYGHQPLSPKRATGQRWNETSLFAQFEQTLDEQELAIARAIYAWMQKGGARKVIFGTGKDYGSVYPLFRPNGISINPAYLSTDGSLWLQFASLDKKPVFGPIPARQALMQQFNAIKGVDLKDSDLTRYPSITLRTIAEDPEGETKVLNALKWMEEQIERA
ncbi:hypothetical protein [Bradyrhizobium stylosanthis]|uniref:hypothetical protein n=1 Tax=Bradyrhizobium stylosanthis TaxID=1803665 RepID=UPI000A66E853|nr:hypothetical protein [Bradyrhizobium stylosanthis]